MIEPRTPSPRAPVETRVRKGRRRWVWTAVVALVLFGGLFYALAAIPLTLPTARADIEARVSRLVGAPVAVDGSVEFSLFPRAQVVLSNVHSLAGEGDAALRFDVDRLEADFDLFDALTGTADIKRVTLVRPEVGPAATGGAESSQGEAATALPTRPDEPPPPTGSDRERLRAFLVRFEGLDELRVRDGLFQLPGMQGSVSNADLDFLWPSEDAPAVLSGSFVWNGQPSTVRAQLDRPLPFFDGQTSALQVQLSSVSGEAGFSGEGSGGENLRLAGALRLSTPSLSRAARWLGRGPFPDLGAFSIETRIELMGERLNLGAVDLDLEGNRARGALEAQLAGPGERQSLSGTLAFRDLDVTRLAQTVAPAPRTILDLQRPIKADFAKGLDIDLRLSAERAKLGSVSATEVAAAIKIMGETGTLDIGDMALLGGRGGMRLGFDVSTGHPVMNANLRLAGVRIEDLGALSQTPLPLGSGSADLETTLRGPAGNWGEILAAGRSTLELRVADGTLRGFDPEIMRTSGRRDLDIAPNGPSTAFRRLSISMRGAGPRMRFASIAMATGEGESEARGTLDLRTHAMRIDGRSLSPVVEASGGQSGAFTSSQPVSFTISGEWPRPVMTVTAPPAPM